MADLRSVLTLPQLRLVEVDAVLVENPTDIWQHTKQSMKLADKSLVTLLREKADQLHVS